MVDMCGLKRKLRRIENQNKHVADIFKLIIAATNFIPSIL